MYLFTINNIYAKYGRIFLIWEHSSLVWSAPAYVTDAFYLNEAVKGWHNHRSYLTPFKQEGGKTWALWLSYQTKWELVNKWVDDNPLKMISIGFGKLN